MDSDFGLSLASLGRAPLGAVSSIRGMLERDITEGVIADPRARELFLACDDAVLADILGSYTHRMPQDQLGMAASVYFGVCQKLKLRPGRVRFLRLWDLTMVLDSTSRPPTYEQVQELRRNALAPDTATAPEARAGACQLSSAPPTSANEEPTDQPSTPPTATAGPSRSMPPCAVVPPVYDEDATDDALASHGVALPLTPVDHQPPTSPDCSETHSYELPCCSLSCSFSSSGVPPVALHQAPAQAQLDFSSLHAPRSASAACTLVALRDDGGCSAGHHDLIDLDMEDGPLLQMSNASEPAAMSTAAASANLPKVPASELHNAILALSSLIDRVNETTLEPFDHAPMSPVRGSCRMSAPPPLLELHATPAAPSAVAAAAAAATSPSARRTFPGTIFALAEAGDGACRSSLGQVEIDAEFLAMPLPSESGLELLPVLTRQPPLGCVPSPATSAPTAMAAVPNVLGARRSPSCAGIIFAMVDDGVRNSSFGELEIDTAFLAMPLPSDSGLEPLPLSPALDLEPAPAPRRGSHAGLFEVAPFEFQARPSASGSTTGARDPDDGTLDVADMACGAADACIWLQGGLFPTWSDNGICTQLPAPAAATDADDSIACMEAAAGDSHQAPSSSESGSWADASGEPCTPAGYGSPLELSPPTSRASERLVVGSAVDCCRCPCPCTPPGTAVQRAVGLKAPGRV